MTLVSLLFRQLISFVSGKVFAFPKFPERKRKSRGVQNGKQKRAFVSDISFLFFNEQMYISPGKPAVRHPQRSEVRFVTHW